MPFRNLRRILGCMQQGGYLTAIFLVGLAVALMVLLGSRRSRRSRRLPTQSSLDDNFDPNDLAEVTASFAAITAEQRRTGPGESAALSARLQRVINRRSPIRAIAPAPVAGATRICFADGTRVLVRNQGGRLAMLAYQAAHYPVCLRSCQAGPEGPELTFDYYGGQVVAVVVGMDQAD